MRLCEEQFVRECFRQAGLGERVISSLGQEILPVEVVGTRQGKRTLPLFCCPLFIEGAQVRVCQGCFGIGIGQGSAG
jgi:hypothetical protein